MQETVEADLLLHVVDAHSRQRAEQIAEVEEVLRQVGAHEVPRIEVFNKIDLIDGGEPRIEYDDSGTAKRIWLSAVTGEGIPGLIEALSERFRGEVISGRLYLGPADGRLRALLFEQGAVVDEYHAKDGGWELDVALKRREYDRLVKREPLIAGCWQEMAETVSKAG